MSNNIGNLSEGHIPQSNGLIDDREAQKTLYEKIIAKTISTLSGSDQFNIAACDALNEILLGSTLPKSEEVIFAINKEELIDETT